MLFALALLPASLPIPSESIDVLQANKLEEATHGLRRSVPRHMQ